MNRLKTIPMYYQMPAHGLRPELAKLYPNGTNTSTLCRDGYRTATTRKPFGKVDDLILIQGCGSQVFRIVAVVQVDFRTLEGQEEWSKREGWNARYASERHGNQVYTGAYQTIFTKCSDQLCNAMQHIAIRKV